MSAAAAKKKDGGGGQAVEGPHSPRFRNRQAFREYDISEKVEAGLKLLGTEVKSLRDGNCQIEDAFARVERGEVLLYNADIAIYPQAVGVLQHEPRRTRKCLLHKAQISTLLRLTQQKGMTIVPLALYFRNGYAKVELGLGRGKQSADRRQDLKEKQMRRDIDRAMRRH